MKVGHYYGLVIYLLCTGEGLIKMGYYYELLWYIYMYWWGSDEDGILRCTVVIYHISKYVLVRVWWRWGITMDCSDLYLHVLVMVWWRWGIATDSSDLCMYCWGSVEDGALLWTNDLSLHVLVRVCCEDGALLLTVLIYLYMYWWGSDKDGALLWTVVISACTGEGLVKMGHYYGLQWSISTCTGEGLMKTL